MPKKKQPRNAFFFFMLDYKARCERNGERFPNGLRDVQENAGAEWNVLPGKEKKRYEDMAKEEKLKLKGNENRVTSLHTRFSDVDKQKLEEEEAKNKMIDTIERTVRSLSTKKLLSEYKFYLIHVNYFCISEGECYIPAELGIAEFCLGEGVTRTYHTIVDPGTIPLGYRHDAMQKSNSTHKIHAEGNRGEIDFYKIWKNIKSFIEPGRDASSGEFPPMYTMPDNVNLNTSISAVKSVIQTLCESGPECEDPDNFRIYSLEKLFLELQNACCYMYARNRPDYDEIVRHAFTHQSFAMLELEKDVFNYTPAIACEFHLEEDAVEFCSKSYVQRWVFLICDHCCQHLGIEVIPGSHLPVNIDVDFSRRRREEEEKPAHGNKPFTWVDKSVEEKAKVPSWNPYEQAPLRRPRDPAVTANLAAMLPTRPEPEPIDHSEANFPSIPLGGRGRGRVTQRGPGNAPPSFAQAMKSNRR